MRLERHTVVFGRRVSICLEPYRVGEAEPWLVVEERWTSADYARSVLSQHETYMAALVAAEGEGGAS